MSFFQKAYSAIIAGFIGSLVGNPADLALVRMQADARLPVEERRNYKNVVDAFLTNLADLLPKIHLPIIFCIHFFMFCGKNGHVHVTIMIC